MQELSPCRLCFLDYSPTRSQTGQVTKVLPRQKPKPPPLISLTPREMASGQASDISSLTSLGNSSAQHAEVMDLSPMLNKKIWTALGWVTEQQASGRGPSCLTHLAEGTCQPALIPTPRGHRACEISSSDTSCTPLWEPSAALPLVPSTPTFTERPKHCVLVAI